MCDECVPNRKFPDDDYRDDDLDPRDKPRPKPDRLPREDGESEVDRLAVRCDKHVD